MKILLLTEFFPKENNGQIPGGSEARTYHLAKELTKLGHKITVMTAFLPGTKKEDNWDGIQIRRVGSRYTYVQSGSNLSRLFFAISCIACGFGEDFDVVDGNNTAVYLAAFVLAKVKFKKVVYWVPDVLKVNGWIKILGPINGFINAFNEFLCLSLGADKIIALSEVTAQKISKPSAVVYPGIERVGNSKPKFPPRTIISVNRLVDYKRVDLVILALASLCGRGRNLNYEIIGEGKEKEGLVALVKKLRLEKRVSFLGNLSKPELLRHVSRAQIFCLASEIEGFGIVTLEAMGFGLPFVNSDIPVHQEISRASNAGILFSSTDVSDLTNKLEQLVSDKKLYERLSQNALKFAAEHTWQKVAKETLEVYKNI